jgi:EAL domain-containing protein (putative c-di-GMP-specific phosphodiesterase class I)
MRTERIVRVLEDELSANGGDPHMIEIELTEGKLLNNSAQSSRMLELFKGMGFRFAIDDFGMGHNSMRYLREFSIDVIKLDGSLTTEVLKDKSSRDIVASIAQLADNLGMKIIAEFVETKEQMEVLRQLGCHIYQGMYYSLALPAAEFETFAKKINAPAAMPPAGSELETKGLK